VIWLRANKQGQIVNMSKASRRSVRWVPGRDGGGAHRKLVRRGNFISLAVRHISIRDLVIMVERSFVIECTDSGNVRADHAQFIQLQ
jgi:hypothetical protein